MPNDIMAYLVVLLGYRLTEYLVMLKSGWQGGGRKQERGQLQVQIPFALTVLGPLVERVLWPRPSGPWHWLAGGVLIATATYLRSRGHRELRASYAWALVKPQAGLITTGLYAHIRHPLYLGNLLLFIGCPLFFNARWTWIATAAGLVGTLLRIQVEERFLQSQFPEYAEYRKRTAALIPGVY